MKTRESRSTFISIPGLIVLAVICIVTAYVRLVSLTVFLLVVLLLMVLSFVWTRFSLKRVEISARAVSCRVFPGEEIKLEISVRNGKILPLLWVEVSLFDKHPKFLEEGSQTGHRISWIMPGRTVSRQIVLKTRARGAAFLDSVQATSGDGFGLGSCSESFALDKTAMMVVYPRVFPVDSSPLADDLRSMQPSDRGRIQDNSLFKGIRDYEAGDSIKNINWRVLARQGQLAVNIYQNLDPGLVTFIFDLESFTVWRTEVTNSGERTVLDSIREDELEEMISLAASCVLSLERRKIRCNLVLPSFGENQMNIRTQEDILTALAWLEYDGSRCFFPQLESHLHTFGQVWIITDRGKLSDGLSSIYGTSRDRGILTYSRDEEDLGGRVLTLQQLRGEA